MSRRTAPRARFIRGRIPTNVYVSRSLIERSRKAGTGKPKRKGQKIRSTKRYRCPICGKRLRTAEGARQHEMTVHGDSDEHVHVKSSSRRVPDAKQEASSSPPRRSRAAVHAPSTRLVQCPCCSVRIPQESLRLHLRESHHLEQPAWTLEHVRRIRRLADQKIMCPKCDLLIRADKLFEHLAVVHRLNPMLEAIDTHGRT